MDIRPPRLVFSSACCPQCWGLRFPTRRAENRGRSSKAVGRAQPAGAAACITTTVFYLEEEGRDTEREWERKGDDEVWGGQERTGGKPREEGEWKIVWYFFCYVGEKNRTSKLGKIPSKFQQFAVKRMTEISYLNEDALVSRRKTEQLTCWHDQL